MLFYVVLFFFFRCKFVGFPIQKEKGGCSWMYLRVDEQQASRSKNRNFVVVWLFERIAIAASLSITCYCRKSLYYLRSVINNQVFILF